MYLQQMRTVCLLIATEHALYGIITIRGHTRTDSQTVFFETNFYFRKYEIGGRGKMWFFTVNL